MKRKGAFYLLILVTGLWTTTACSQDLSRSRAEHLITDSQDFKSPLNMRLLVGSFWAGPDYYNKPAWLKTLEQNGVLTYRESGRTSLFQREAFIDLTPFGKDESKTWAVLNKDFNSKGMERLSAVLYSIPVAQRRFKQVTGIRLDPGGKGATVDYEFVWVPTSEKAFKGLVNPDALSEHAKFELYDDGWRLAPKDPRPEWAR